MAIDKDYNNYYEKIGNEYNDIRLDAKNDRENVIGIIKKYANSKHKKNSRHWLWDWKIWRNDARKWI